MRLGADTPFLVWLLLGPFYLLPSGLPQVADGAMLALACPLVVIGCLRFGLSGAEVLALVALGAWTWAVNVAFFVLHADPLFLKKGLFWLYNLGFFALALSALRAGGVAASGRMGWVALAALVVELGVVTLAPDYLGKRQIGTFNNPNQLAYWALLSAGIAALSFLNAPAPRRVPAALALLIAGYLVGLSLSKAGMLAMLILAAGAAGPLTGLRAPMLGLLAVTAAALLLLLAMMGVSLPGIGALSNTEFVQAILGRVNQVQADDSLASRGYFRIFDHPWYLIAGAGEGALWRLSHAAGKEAEIHSTLLQFLTSYGLIGLALMAWFLSATIRRPGPLAWAVIAAVLVYGLAHNGLRFTHFWCLLAVLAAQAPRPDPVPQREFTPCPSVS